MPATAAPGVQAVIAGGGPAGMMAGYILARAGVRVMVLEKHGDFLRDFRGDTVHPSTMEAMWELGLLDRFLQCPHDRIEQLSGQVGPDLVHMADLRHLPTHARFVALMPQWDFLNFLSREGARFPEFDVRMRTEATDLIVEGERVVGVRATGPEGVMEIRAEVVIAADGRTSALRDKAGLAVHDLGAPMDVLWMRLPRRPGDEEMPLGRITAGLVFVAIPRGDYFQCGYVVAKGGYDHIRAQGLAALKASIAAASPGFADRVDTLRDWDQIKLLSVSVDRLKTWARPGLLCIGDAAHAMSPIGGVGINLAIQDAVAAANALAGPLREGTLSFHDLQAVQGVRERPTAQMQALQLFIQQRVIGRALKARGGVRAPWPAKLFNALPWLRRIPARVIGMGFRMEHVRTPDAHAR
ncbi:FAD-dependent oxidoreductase [Caulobacter sp. KR2-114]|uniref:FAD-dependent oxidoreductase n=1 Tax=Caulobacter sp. KR2-114 TaxID=3400912 RepID=UPI003BFAF9FD